MIPGVAIRPYRPTDEAFVYDSWLKCLRPEYPDMRTLDFNVWQRGRIDHVIEIGDVLIAHPENEPEVIWGWLALMDDNVHFVYVRPEHRKQRIATAMLMEAGWRGHGEVIIRAVTDDVRAIKRAHPEALRYIPV